MKLPRAWQGVLVSLFLLLPTNISLADVSVQTPSAQPSPPPERDSSVGKLTKSAIADTPSTLVLGTAIFLMIGYGWLRKRWSNENEEVKEEEMDWLDNPPVSVEKKVVVRS